jgi:hypothetical protein
LKKAFPEIPAISSSKLSLEKDLFASSMLTMCSVHPSAIKSDKESGSSFVKSFCGTLRYFQATAVRVVAFSHHSFAARSLCWTSNDSWPLLFTTNRFSRTLFVIEGRRTAESRDSRISEFCRRTSMPAKCRRSFCSAYGRRPSGRTSSFVLSSALSAGVPAFHGGMGALPGGYRDSMGSQTLSTRSVNKSPISMSVMVP